MVVQTISSVAQPVPTVLDRRQSTDQQAVGPGALLGDEVLRRTP